MGELVFPIMKTIQHHAVVMIIFKGFTAKSSSEMVSGTVKKLVPYDILKFELFLNLRLLNLNLVCN